MERARWVDPPPRSVPKAVVYECHPAATEALVTSTARTASASARRRDGHPPRLVGMMPLRRPTPPFVEVGVYDAVRSEQEVFQGVLDCLVARGAGATGRGLALRGIGPTDAFEGPTDGVPVEVPIERLEDVHDLVGPDDRLVEVEVVGGVGFDPAHFARLTYLRVERAHLRVDRHPVALLASGSAFSGPPTHRTRTVGKEVRRLFEEIVRSVGPAYGAVTVEVPLGSPGQIAADPRCWWDHRDFYVSDAHAGTAAIARIDAASAGLDVRSACNGLFVFSSSAFGGPGTDHEAAGRAFTSAVAMRARRGPAAPA